MAAKKQPEDRAMTKQKHKGLNDRIKDILDDTRVIAVVGVSEDPSRVSHKIFDYLSHHFKVVPVNPNRRYISGKKSYGDVADIPQRIDLVNIFRPQKEALEIVRSAVKKGAKAVWMQVGIKNEKAKELAEKNGIETVMDRCIMREHKRLASESQKESARKG